MNVYISCIYVFNLCKKWNLINEETNDIHYEPLWYAARTGKNINLLKVMDIINWKLVG